MRIIIENGKRSIKASVAEAKAWATVLRNLDELQNHAGGELADHAEETTTALFGFRDELNGECEWAAERAKAVATK